MAARAVGIDPATQELAAGGEVGIGPRVALATERGQLLPPLKDALRRWARHRAIELRTRAPDGVERRRAFRPWRYQHTGGWA